MCWRTHQSSCSLNFNAVSIPSSSNICPQREPMPQTSRTDKAASSSSCRSSNPVMSKTPSKSRVVLAKRLATLGQFNQQIEEYLLLAAELRLLSIKYPRADNVLMRERNALTDDPLPFLGISQIDRWHEAGSFDNLLRRNQAALQYLRDSLARFKANPFPAVAGSRN